MMPVVFFDGGVNGLGAVRSLGKLGIKVFVLNDRINTISANSRYASFIKAPKVENNEEFIDFLIRFGKKFPGTILSPDSDPVVLLISKNIKKLKKYFKVPLPSYKTAETIVDKEKFYKWAIKKKLPIPKTFFLEKINIKDVAKKVKYPVLIKPKDSFAFVAKFGKKLTQADSEEDLIKKYNYIKDYVDVFIQEKIPGGDSLLYTFGSYCNKDSKVLASFTCKKIRQYPIKYGHCSYGESVKDEELVKVSKKILKSYNYHGISQTEFKKDPRDGKFKLLEINARSWSWHHLSTTCGVNLHHAMYSDLLGLELPHFEQINTPYGWLYFYKDLFSIFQSYPGLINWLKSIRGPKEYAVFSREDIRPFYIEMKNKTLRVFKKLFKREG